MKKVFVLFGLVCAFSCSNPEDQATGNPDSTIFNENEVNNTNSGTQFNRATGSAALDSSAAPALEQENANSRTHGTNRPYGNGQDSGKK